MIAVLLAAVSGAMSVVEVVTGRLLVFRRTARRYSSKRQIRVAAAWQAGLAFAIGLMLICMFLDWSIMWAISIVLTVVAAIGGLVNSVRRPRLTDLPSPVVVQNTAP